MADEVGHVGEKDNNSGGACGRVKVDLLDRVCLVEVDGGGLCRVPVDGGPLERS